MCNGRGYETVENSYYNPYCRECGGTGQIKTGWFSYKECPECAKRKPGWLDKLLGANKSTVKCAGCGGSGRESVW